MVLSTVPPVPLAQATVPSTESMPRSPAVVPESCICHTELLEACARAIAAMGVTARARASSGAVMRRDGLEGAIRIARSIVRAATQRVKHITVG